MRFDVNKKIFFSMLVFGLFFAVVCYLKYSKFDNIDSISIITSRREIYGHIANITINNIDGVYNLDENTFYFSINDEVDSSVSNIKINSFLGFKYKVIDDNIYNFNDSKILLYNDKYYQILNIKFVPISIISLHTFPELDNIKKIKNNKYDFEVLNNENNIQLVEDKNIVINVNTANAYSNSNSYSYEIFGSYHVRGASSLIFEKKSYKIDLLKNDSLLNLNSSKDWVLDAIYNDSSKVRNKLSSDLWNMINDNQKQDNDLQSEFVELFIDDRYVGLYVLKNSVTKKMLSISNNGILVKPFTNFNDYNKNMLFNGNYSIVGNAFLNFEMKHYSDIDYDVNMFTDKLKDLIISNYDFNSLDKNYYIDNYINYKILISLIQGVDNTEKNYYISMIDKNDKFLITPWDMDLTFGNNWDPNVFNGESFYDKSCFDKSWLDINVYNINSDKVNYLIKQRYWELRKDVITMDVINGYLDNYKTLLVESGAAFRDSNRWYRYDIEQEIEKIRTWANNRINFLDEYFKM